MKDEAIEAMVLAVVSALIFAAGWAVEGWRKDVEIAGLKKMHAEEQRQAVQEVAVKLARAQKLGDQLALQLAGWESTLVAFAQEKEREIKHLTTGRRCLDGAAVSLLNESARREQSRPVPEASGEPVRADATFATDTDVGTWIAGAQRSYDTCRGRLDAIAEFYRSSDKGE